ncbi:class I SAM-dependent methyltransferase [Halorussus salilacus]|uniref:class I SAM-dependent methyltransferase n=1 Tax=Halorussus salilacus TaxID=2953750 RepID=UPI00209D71D0|nr:class I SAM-dependent methyltransferase [Halorussus salilacus]USZ68771.1 class I SAM-dependent methyltransferase [Halorussus salilacus]
MTDPETVATYQSVADEYRERHADRSGVAELVEEFLTAVEDATGGAPGRVADVGCGPGWESATFADRGHEVVAADLTPAFLRVAREEAPDAAFARMDMRSLGFAADAFDGLWACASFLHVPREDAPATLREFRRTVRPDGVAYLSVKRGDGEKEGDGYEGDSRRFTLYRAGELRSLVSDAGFEVESLSDGEWITLLARA